MPTDDIGANVSTRQIETPSHLLDFILEPALKRGIGTAVQKWD